MGVTASTMSLTVDRLQRGGYVHRERSTVDRRRVDLRLTEAGVRIKKQQKVLEPELVSQCWGIWTNASAGRRCAGWNCWRRRRAR